MSRPTAGPSRPLGTNAPKSNQPAQTSGGGPRRSAGAVPGIARTASSLRQSSPLNPSSSIGSIPAHLRNLSTPRIPSPLGKGTPARQTKQSLPVRTSKTTERHVLLPEDPQLAPIPEGSPRLRPKGSAPPPRSRDYASGQGPSRPGPDERSEAEKMTKRERQENRLPRLTAYATAEGYRLKLLQAFLKREHGVGVVRVFDDCVYAIYTLPLLPGYGASTKTRSSPHVKSPGGVSLLERMTMAEDMGYDDTYFPSTNLDETDPHLHSSSHPDPSEYILSHSPPSSLLPTDLISTSLDIAAGHEAEREQEIEAVQERLELGDGFQNSALGLLQAEDDVGVRSATEHTNHHGERIIQSLGTHVDPNHPGHLEHIPALATSPSDLPDGPIPTKHYQRSPRTSSHEMSPESERRSETSSEGAHSPMLPIDISTPSTISSTMNHNSIRRMPRMRRKSTVNLTGKVAEAVFFNYGVSVFFGFDESEERDIMEDCEGAGVWMRPQQEDDWDIEEFHYVYDPDAEYPRIYNDMFTFKSHSHLFKLSLAHAIAQSTKLSIFEQVMQDTLALTSSFPKELAVTGHLQLTRRQALKMTGRLFKLRMDVNLIGGILDTPELFWSEASLYPLYEAIREYLEIGPRAQVLSDRLAVAGDLLEIIHEYIGERGTDRVTWIVIWLIVIACLVEFGEVIARLVFHAIPRDEGEFLLVKGTKAVVETILR